MNLSSFQMVQLAFVLADLFVHTVCMQHLKAVPSSLLPWVQVKVAPLGMQTRMYGGLVKGHSDWLELCMLLPAIQQVNARAKL
jgi:hypothetical protein